MTTNQVYLGVSLTLGLAVGCQLLGSRLKIPAIILLLPAGFIAGWATTDVNPNNLLGSSFQPLVSLAVAVILYDAGLSLNVSKLTGHPRRVVIRLLGLGIPITWVATTAVAGPLFGMDRGAAVMLGVILVVSGPTVVGPLLSAVRPAERLRHTLMWEGSLIDPVGGLLGAVVFHGVTASQKVGPARQLLQFLGSVGIGAIGGAVGIALLWFLLCKLHLGEALGTSVQLAVVVVVAAGCDALRDDTGLIAAVTMGLALANSPIFDMPARQPFFEILVQLIIGILFVSISATVTPSSIHHLILPTLALVAILVLAVRPLAALASTLRTDLTRGERGFVGWMAPRGIVAAATASTFAAALVAQGVTGASKILPVTFLVIVLTVTIYGLTASPVARWFGVAQPRVTRPLVVGGEPWVIDLAQALRSTGISVIMWADSVEQRTNIRGGGLELAQDSLLVDATGAGVEMEGVTEILLLTAEHGFNAIAATLLEGGEGGRVYRVRATPDALDARAGGDVLFDARLTRDFIVREYGNGARITLGAPDIETPADQVVLFRVRVNGQLEPATAAKSPAAPPGDATILFGPINVG